MFTLLTAEVNMWYCMHCSWKTVKSHVLIYIRVAACLAKGKGQLCYFKIVCSFTSKTPRDYTKPLRSRKTCLVAKVCLLCKVCNNIMMWPIIHVCGILVAYTIIRCLIVERLLSAWLPHEWNCPLWILNMDYCVILGKPSCAPQ